MPSAAALPDSAVKKVFSTDKRIKFCAVVNSDGRVEAGGMRPGVRPLEPEGETRRIVTRMFLNQTTSEATDPYLGRARWLIVQREKVVQITFPLPNQRQLQITATLDYPISKVARLSRYIGRLGIKV